MAGDGGVLSAEEKAAMKALAAERRAEAKAKDKRAAGLKALQDAIAEMDDADRALAERVSEIVAENAPDLLPKTWYGMPAWANADGKTVVFFQSAGKFTARYATLGFDEAASLDDGPMWATSYALLSIGAPEAKAITELVRRAAGV